MSIFHPATLICPNCSTANTVERNASVNADRRPDLRDAVLDGSFQATECTKCGTALRLPPHLTYMDLQRKQWILAHEPDHLDEWPQTEAAARDTYARSFGDQAPEMARRLGAGIHPRIVFGWMALREKLICDELGLDDTSLELLKMAVMTTVDKPPIADQTELRLVGGNDEALDLSWVVTATEERLADLSVPRDIYDGVAGDTEAWEDVREKFDGKLLVDLRRFVAGPVA